MGTALLLHSLSDGKSIVIVHRYVAAVRPLFDETRDGAVIYMGSGVRHEVGEAFDEVCRLMWPLLTVSARKERG